MDSHESERQRLLALVLEEERSSYSIRARSTVAVGGVSSSEQVFTPSSPEAAQRSVILAKESLADAKASRNPAIIGLAILRLTVANDELASLGWMGLVGDVPLQEHP